MYTGKWGRIRLLHRICKDKTWINLFLFCYYSFTYVIKGDSGFTAAADRHSYSRRIYFTVALLTFCGFSLFGNEAGHNVDEFLLSSRTSTQLKSKRYILVCEAVVVFSHRQAIFGNEKENGPQRECVRQCKMKLTLLKKFINQVTVINEHEQHFRISTYFEGVEHGSVAFLCESHAQVFRHEDLFPEITIALQIPISNVLIREHTILVNTFKYKANVVNLICYFWIYVNYKNEYLSLSILSLADATVWTLLLDTTLLSDISIYNCNKCI